MRCANFEFVQFVAKLEKVYSILGSEEYIATIGPNIVDHICVSLMKETDVTVWFVQFIPPDTKPQCFEDLVTFLLMIYSRICGEDFAMKLLKVVQTSHLKILHATSYLNSPPVLFAHNLYTKINSISIFILLCVTYLISL